MHASSLHPDPLSAQAFRPVRVDAAVAGAALITTTITTLTRRVRWLVFA